MKLHLLIFLALFWSVGCQTTSYVTKVDKQRKNIEVQSQADSGSAIFALNNAGALKKMKESLLKDVEKNPKNIKSLLNLSQISLAEGNLEDANKYCRKALKYDLDNKDARLILAQVYFRRGYTDMADILLNSLGKAADKDPKALNLKALIELNKDNPSLAMNLFKTALRYSLGDVATRMNLGVLFVYYRQIDKAAVQFERVLKVMPDHIDAKLHLAVVKTSKGQLEQAENLYRDVLDADSKNAIATYNLAVLAEKRDEFDDSLEYVKKYLNSNYAKSKSNKEVFAMIERLKVKKDMRGDRVSDSEIQELAGKINDMESNPIKTSANRNTIENPGLGDGDSEERIVNSNKPKRAVSQPSKVNRPEPVKPKRTRKKPSQDSIESLEEELLK